MNIEFYDDEFSKRELIKAQFLQYLTGLSLTEKDALIDTIISSKIKTDSCPAVKEIIFVNFPEKTKNLKCIHFKGRLIMVELERITHIYHKGRNAFFYFTDSESSCFRCSLSELVDTLDMYSEMFVRISHVEYVNIFRIRELSNNTITLDSKEMCTISRSYMIYVRNRLKSYDFLLHDKSQ